MNIRNTLMAAGTAATMMVGGATKAVAQEVQPRAVRQITTTAADTLKKADAKAATFDILSRIDSIARSQADSLAVAKSDSVQARKPLFEGYIGALGADYMKEGAGIMMGTTARKGADVLTADASYIGKHHNAIMDFNFGYNRDVYTFANDSNKMLKAYAGARVDNNIVRNHTYATNSAGKSINKHDQYAVFSPSLNFGIQGQKVFGNSIMLRGQIEGGPAYSTKYVAQSYADNKKGHFGWRGLARIEAGSASMFKKHNQPYLFIQGGKKPYSNSEQGYRGWFVNAGAGIHF